jgi:hypothetical protein
LDGVLQRQVGLAAESVEGIEVTAGIFDHFQRLRQLAQCLDQLIGSSRRPLVFRVSPRPAGGAETLPQLTLRTSHCVAPRPRSSPAAGYPCGSETVSSSRR